MHHPVMEAPEQDECSCDLKLGVDKLSSQDVLNSQELERKYKLVNQAIHFLGACNSFESCKIKEKINEIRENIGEFYFDNDKNLIAIPNQITLPKRPFVLDSDETDPTKKRRNDKYLDDYCEDLLHQSIIKALRNMNKQSFVMKGFQSGDCIKAKIEKGKTLRIETKCKCKADKDCNCGKFKYPDLNIHEKQVMEILEIMDVEDEELVKCVRWLREWKKNEKLSNEEKTWLYSKVLQSVKKDSLKNVPVHEMEKLFRYYWYIFKIQKVCMEWDILVILPQWKLIINIEVKRGAGLHPLRTAAKQTDIHLSIFKRIFGAHLNSEWKFVKAACTPNLDLSGESQPCEYCTKFIISDLEILNISPWIEKIIKYHSFKEEHFKKEYEDLLIGIIGFSSIRQSNQLNKLVVNPHAFSKETETRLTAQDIAIHGENEEDRNKLREAFEVKNYKSEYLCYMLTPDQLMAVKDPSSHIIIEGDYGCGKTYVLKERTKQCAEKYPESKIAYINVTIDPYFSFNSHSTNMMDMIAENNFKDYNNIEVVTFKDWYDHYTKNEDGLKKKYLSKGEDFGIVIKHFLKHSTYDHVFIDEMPPFRRKTGDFFSTDKTYCITMKCDVYKNNKNKEWIKQMEQRYNAKRIILSHNMRNSETIVNISTCFDINNSKYDNLIRASVIPKKNITGPVCYHYHNIHKLDTNMLARAAIKKYFPKSLEPVVVVNPHFTLLKSNSTTLYESLQEYFSSDRNIVYLPADDEYADYEKCNSEVKEYLRKPEGILVTNIGSFCGAQARNIIIFNDENIDLRNMILRTLSFAIIIHNNDNKQSVPGLVRDVDLHEFIHPGNTEQLFCNDRKNEHRSSCNWPLNPHAPIPPIDVTSLLTDTDQEHTPNHVRKCCCNLL